jgi:hypothetical protein
MSRFGGCSCHYRHDTNGLGFGPTEKCVDEDPEDVEATRHVYDLLHRIVTEGHQIDLLDVWESREQGIRLIIELDRAPRDHFRFLEGVLMELRRSPAIATS